jgi:hypothetical protein
MIERRDGAGLALEAVAEFFGGDFDGDGAVEPGVAGAVYTQARMPVLHE